MPTVRVRGAVISVASLLALAAVFAALLGNLSNAVAARDNCRNIDDLYTRVRDNANRSFDELPQNARLLGIKLTPAAIHKARMNRDRTLKQYAPLNCSIWLWK